MRENAKQGNTAVELQIKSLSFARSGTKILDQLSYNFLPGKVTLLTGPSGCGKTTLLRLIAGLEAPDNGEIIAETTVWSNRKQLLPPWLRHLDLLFQKDALWPDQTVEQQIDWVRSRTQFQQKDNYLHEIYEELGISNLLNRFPAGLSGGEARRCQLARVLASGQPLLLFDEPLASQDAAAADKTAHLLMRILDERAITAIVVSHETMLFKKAGWQELYLPDINGSRHA
jgi:iron(III) transport system ATP-binding protein